MRTAAGHLKQAALSLPLGERARLATALIDSLDQDPEVEAAWEREISRRMAMVESGEANVVPADDVFAEAAHEFHRANQCYEEKSAGG
jgi:putative addiction module component (TIGR02574 family)